MIQWFSSGAMRYNRRYPKQLRRPGRGAWRRFLVAAVCGLVLLAARPSLVEAQYGSKKKPPAGATIPEDKRPWGGKPWLAGILLTAGTLAVAAKNAKRSHLD